MAGTSPAMTSKLLRLHHADQLFELRRDRCARFRLARRRRCGRGPSPQRVAQFRARGASSARPGSIASPPAWVSRFTARASSSTMTGARPSDGSSINRTVGLPISARPIASICCSPPESWLPRLLARSASRGNSSKTFVHRPGPRPRRHLEVFTQGKRGKNLALLRHVAEPGSHAAIGRKREMSLPWSERWPPCKVVWPMMVASNVVLPTPLRPMIETVSPHRA